MKEKKIIIVLSVISIFIILLCGVIYFINYYINYDRYYKIDSRVDNVYNTRIQDAETIGWIKIQGTDIDYPVINETDNAYYSGEDYLWRINSYKEGNNREVIYGHNILNVSSKPIVTDPDHTRFEQLMSFVYEDFASKNLYVQYSKGSKDYLYKIYAIGFIKRNDEKGNSFSTKEETKEYIKSTLNNSIYKYNVDVNENDEIISLITCTRYFGVSGKNQFRVDARLLRKNERITKYNIETTGNYDIIK